MSKLDVSEYKQILSSLDEEQALDLPVHLYSSFLMRRVDPAWPLLKWSLWPLPYSEVPDPDDGLYYQDDLIPAKSLTHEPYEAFSLFRDDMAESEKIRLINRASNDFKLLRGKQKIIERIAYLDSFDPNKSTNREFRDRLRRRRIAEARLLLYPVKPKVKRKRPQSLIDENAAASAEIAVALEAKLASSNVSTADQQSTRDNLQNPTDHSQAPNNSAIDGAELESPNSTNKEPTPAVGDNHAPAGSDPSIVADELDTTKQDHLAAELGNIQPDVIPQPESSTFAIETSSTTRNNTREDDFNTAQQESESMPAPKKKPGRGRPSAKPKKTPGGSADDDLEVDYSEDIKYAKLKRAHAKDSEWLFMRATYDIIQDHPNSKEKLLSAIGAEIERNITRKIRQKVKEGSLLEGNDYDAGLIGASANKALAVVVASKLDNLLNTISTVHLNSKPLTKNWRHVLVAAVESEESPYKLYDISPYERIYPKCEELFENICYEYKRTSDEAEDDLNNDSGSSHGFDVYKYLEHLDQRHHTTRREEHYKQREWEKVELRMMKNLFYNKLSLQLSAKTMSWWPKRQKGESEEIDLNERLQISAQNEGISFLDYVHPGLEKT